MDFLIPHGNGMFCHEKAGLAFLPENNHASNYSGSHWSSLDEITEGCYQHQKQRDRQKENRLCSAARHILPCCHPQQSAKAALHRAEACRGNLKGAITEDRKVQHADLTEAGRKLG